jgi:hypothetical protein
MKTCSVYRSLGASAAVVALSLQVSPACAQAEDQAAARSLFDSARQLAKAGHYAAACPKFDAASKLYPSAGILLNLADCYEKIGKTASAWTEFGEAASVASRTHRQEDASEAKRRQSGLEPGLTRLMVRVAHEEPGLLVQRDGSPLPRAVWGTAIPVDPGSYELHAEAAGFEPWTAPVNASTSGQTVTVDVPELRPSPSAPPPASASNPTPAAAPQTAPQQPPAPPPRSSGGGSSNAAGWTLVVLGAAVGIAGGALVIIESGRSSNAKDLATYNSAQTMWTVGVVGAIAGGVSAAGGIVLLAFSHGDSPSTGVRAVPWVGAGTEGVGLVGTW